MVNQDKCGTGHVDSPAVEAIISVKLGAGDPKGSGRTQQGNGPAQATCEAAGKHVVAVEVR